jgi:hypothetical protein
MVDGLPQTLMSDIHLCQGPSAKLNSASKSSQPLFTTQDTRPDKVSSSTSPNVPTSPKVSLSDQSFQLLWLIQIDATKKVTIG